MRQLNTLLQSCNLSNIVKFLTRIGLTLNSANDNIFLDISSTGKYELYSLTNGLSDHEAQLLIICNTHKQIKEGHTVFKRKINEYYIADF
jgi:hypothetical protein